MNSTEAKPQAFSFSPYFEAKKHVPWDEIASRINEDLQFFTGEYILEQQITRYHYELRRNFQGQAIQIFSPAFISEGDVINSFARDQSQRGRVEYLGFQKIEQAIFRKRLDGGFFVWISPPGRPEDGFGSHNFTFIGHVLEDRVDMVAYKNWLSKKTNIDFINRYLPFQEGKILTEVASDLDFLQNPVFFPGREFHTHEEVIKFLDPPGITKENDYRWLFAALQPARRTILEAVRGNDCGGAEILKRAHDNLGLALLQGQDQGVLDLAYWVSLPAPILRGSCGFSGVESVFGGGLRYLGVENTFPCPRCHRGIPSGRGFTTCPHCGARKEDYKKCD